MLLMGVLNAVFSVLIIVVIGLIIAQLLLLAGRFVRAVEKIAEKFDKKT